MSVSIMNVESVVFDLDNSLAKTDLLLEQVIVLARKSPFLLLCIPFWLFRGRAYLKSRIAECVSLNTHSIPFRDELLARAKAEKAQGRQVVLASASHVRIVKQVADHLKVFDQVIGTDAVNLKGKKKISALSSILNGRPFSYVGDSYSDLEIWAHAKAAVAVNVAHGTRRGLSRLKIPTEYIDDQKNPLWLILRALRVHQCSKNILLLVPVVFAHRLLDVTAVLAACMGVLSFSLMACSIYMVNDLMDLESDRLHARKRHRPFASGELSLIWGMLLPPLMASMSLGIAWVLSHSFFVLIILYAAMNVAYSSYVKRVPILDVLFLAFFYTIRILAGGAAVGVQISYWLLNFSVFFFFGLALIKRYIEVSRLSELDDVPGRGYSRSDMDPIFAMGIGSSLLSVLVFSLYLHSPEVGRLYAHADRLWLIAPILLYWLVRLWFLANRDKIHDDPVVFAIKDGTTWIVVAVSAVILMLGTGL